MRMSFARLFRHEAGQSIVELALAVPILVFALIGGIDLMRVAAIQQAVQNAARVGVEVASGNNDASATGNPVSTLLTDMKNELSSTPGLWGVTVQWNSCGGSACPAGSGPSCSLPPTAGATPCASLPAIASNLYQGTCYTATGAICATPTCTHSGAGAVCYVTVSVQYTFKTLVPWWFVPNQITVNRGATMPLLKTS